MKIIEKFNNYSTFVIALIGGLIYLFNIWITSNPTKNTLSFLYAYVYDTYLFEVLLLFGQLAISLYFYTKFRSVIKAIFYPYLLMIYAAISIFSPLYTHLVLPFYKPKVNLTESIESPTTKREKEKRFSFFFDLLLLGLFLISIFITCITILPSVASLEYSKASLLIKSTPPDLYRYLSNKAQFELNQYNFDSAKKYYKVINNLFGNNQHNSMISTQLRTIDQTLKYKYLLIKKAKDIEVENGNHLMPKSFFIYLEAYRFAPEKELQDKINKYLALNKSIETFNGFINSSCENSASKDLDLIELRSKVLDDFYGFRTSKVGWDLLQRSLTSSNSSHNVSLDLCSYKEIYGDFFKVIYFQSQPTIKQEEHKKMPRLIILQT